jgi:hypothetical protein
MPPVASYKAAGAAAFKTPSARPSSRDADFTVHSYQDASHRQPPGRYYVVRK